MGSDSNERDRKYQRVRGSTTAKVVAQAPKPSKVAEEDKEFFGVEEDGEEQDDEETTDEGATDEEVAEARTIETEMGRRSSRSAMDVDEPSDFTAMPTRSVASDEQMSRRGKRAKGKLPLDEWKEVAAQVLGARQMVLDVMETLGDTCTGQELACLNSVVEKFGIALVRLDVVAYKQHQRQGSGLFNIPTYD